MPTRIVFKTPVNGEEHSLTVPDPVQDVIDKLRKGDWVEVASAGAARYIPPSDVAYVESDETNDGDAGDEPLVAFV
jgi:hypothetical protein